MKRPFISRIIPIIVLSLSLFRFSLGDSSWYSPWGAGEKAVELRLLQVSNEGFTLKLELHGYYREVIEHNSSVFQRLILERDFHATTMDLGAPEIPLLAKLIELPPQAEVEIEIKALQIVEIPPIEIFPFQSPAFDGEIPAVFSYDETAYSNGEPYPNFIAQVEDIGVMRDKKVGSLKIAPIRYIPAERKLILAREMELNITFKPKTSTNFPAPAHSSPTVETMYRSLLLNYRNNASFNNIDDPEFIKYLIIVNPGDEEYLQPLIDYQQNRGLPVEMRTPEPGFCTPQEFKNYITELYLTYGLEYVLLVGDPYLGIGPSPTVPMYYWTYNPENPSFSDSWYSCLVPGDSSDHYPEIAVGRLVYQYDYQLQNLVQKTLDYLTNPDTSEDWFKRSLLIAHQEGYPGGYTACKEEVRLYPYAQEIPEFTALYGGEGYDNEDIVNFINSASCGLLNYRGHGTNDEWPVWSNGIGSSFSGSEVAQFTNNNRLFVVLDIACLNNNTVNYNGTCLGETFMKEEGGAVAFLGALEPTYTNPNHLFDKEIYKQFFQYGVWNIGYAVHGASMEVMNAFGAYGMDNFRIYYWQGDPAIDLWTHIPQMPEVIAPDTIGISTVSVDIGVISNGLPQVGAMVCLHNTEIYSVAYADSNGSAHLSLSSFVPLQPGSVYLTVTGHNLALFQDTVQVIDSLAMVPENRISALPTEFRLHQNYPNPFNHSTEVVFEIPSACNVIFSIFDLQGRKVSQRMVTISAPTIYIYTFENSALTSGLYFFRAEAKSYQATRKILLLR
jgi:hypothetical protein